MTTATSPRKSDLLNDQIKGLAGSAPHQDNIFKEASRLRNLTFEKARENIVIKMPTMPINPQNDYLKVRCFLGSASSFPTMMPSDSSFYPGMFKVLSRVRSVESLCEAPPCHLVTLSPSAVITQWRYHLVAFIVSSHSVFLYVYYI